MTDVQKCINKQTITYKTRKQSQNCNMYHSISMKKISTSP